MTRARRRNRRVRRLINGKRQFQWSMSYNMLKSSHAELINEIKQMLNTPNPLTGKKPYGVFVPSGEVPADSDLVVIDGFKELILPDGWELKW